MIENGGWNRPSTDVSREKCRAVKSTAIRGIIAGLLVVVVASIAAWLILSPAHHRAGKTSKVKPVEARPIKRSTPSRPRPSFVTNQVVKKGSVTPLEKWHGHEIVSRKSVTNGVNVVITMIDKDGKVYKELKKTTKPIFTNPVDQVLAMVLSNPPGTSVAPLPALGSNADELFAKAIQSPIVINDDDPENVKKAKLLVQGARAQILEEIEKGRSVMEVISDHVSTVNDNNKLHAEVRNTYEKMIADGDLEGAEKYREKANKILENAGAEQVSMHGMSRRTRKENEK